MVKYLNFKVFQAEQGGQTHHYEDCIAQWMR